MSEMNMKTLSSDWYKKYMDACNNRLNSISVTPTEVRLLVECIDANIAASKAQTDEWRCFHCDEVFTDAEQAALHFGVYRMQEMHTPACQIDIAEYRRMEAENKAYREEDAPIHRSIHRAQSDAIQAIRRAEEQGYAKGLAASKAQTVDVEAIREVIDAMGIGNVNADRVNMPIAIFRGWSDKLAAALPKDW